MDLELLTLKMAVVADDDATQSEILRHAAAMATVPVEVAIFGLGESAAAAARDMLTRGVDMLFLDADLMPAVRDSLVKAARAGRENAIIVLIGAADAEASSDGVGADATLEKPFDLAKAGAAVECCARARRPHRVLVVDDSPTVRAIVRKMLRASRFSLDTEETGDGAAALGLVRSGRFDIVFLDCNMPGVDGFAALAEIERSHPGIATVMMTGTPDQSIAVHARAAGAKGFLFKPFFPKEIDATLRGLFGLRVPKESAADAGARIGEAAAEHPSATA